MNHGDTEDTENKGDGRAKRADPFFLRALRASVVHLSLTEG